MTSLLSQKDAGASFRRDNDVIATRDRWEVPASGTFYVWEF